MKKISEILTETRDLLSVESRWTKGMAAQDENGFGVSVNNIDACRWCLIGGIMKVLGDNGLTHEIWDLAYNGSRQALAMVIHQSSASIALWNDTEERKHSEVIAALNTAISVATAKELIEEREA